MVRSSAYTVNKVKCLVTQFDGSTQAFRQGSYGSHASWHSVLANQELAIELITVLCIIIWQGRYVHGS